MDFSVITDQFAIVVLLACLVVGYIIKKSLNFIPNKYIPTILAIIGAVLNSIVSGVTVDSIVYGAITGLASTGMHQAFTKFIEGKSEE